MIDISQTALFHAHLKVERANRHINELKAVINAFQQSDFCSLTIERNTKGLGDCVTLNSISQLPADIPLCIGDAVHNLRSALDHAASRIMVAAGRSPDATFPVQETREGLIETFRPADPTGTACITCNRGARKAGGNHPIKIAAPDFADFLTDTIKPYLRGDGECPHGQALYRLTKANNIDKHRFLMPVVGSVNVTIDAKDQAHNTFSGNTVTVPLGRSVPIINTTANITEYSHSQPIANIIFGDGTPFEGYPVLETLSELSQLVSETLKIIEREVSLLNS